MLVSAASASSPASQSNRSDATQTLAADLETFLRILTTQLKTQDPTAPMDAQAFTQQLVQFSTVEQAILTNKKLDQLVRLSRAAEAGTALGYVGAEVEIDGTKVMLDPGRGATVTLATEAPGTARIRLLDQRGVAVRELEQAVAPGTSRIVWDGRTATGGTAPAGAYRAVVTVRDGFGRELPVQTSFVTRVESVEIGAEGIVLVTEHGRAALDTIGSIRRGAAGPAAA
jgi:flagellar basal-body rod modification protein FlgD